MAQCPAGSAGRAGEASRGPGFWIPPQLRLGAAGGRSKLQTPRSKLRRNQREEGREGASNFLRVPTLQPVGAREENQYPSGQRSGWRLRRQAGTAARCGWGQPRSDRIKANQGESNQIKPFKLFPSPDTTTGWGSGGSGHKAVSPGSGAKRRRVEREDTRKHIIEITNADPATITNNIGRHGNASGASFFCSIWAGRV